MFLFLYRLNKKIGLWLAKENFCRQIKQKPYGLKVLGPITNRASSVHIGKNVTIYSNVIFWGSGDIFIGDDVSISDNVMIYSGDGGSVTIGNDSSIGSFTYIIDSDHGIRPGSLIRLQKSVTGPIKIGKDVWIGAQCMILRGSSIDDGSVIGACSLVKTHIKGNSVYYGSPAKFIKERR